MMFIIQWSIDLYRSQFLLPCVVNVTHRRCPDFKIDETEATSPMARRYNHPIDQSLYCTEKIITKDEK
jgi:hypothetical protein